MKCYFIDWTKNWADEMEVYSAEVLTESELKDFKKWVKKHKEELKNGFDFGIGTNEDIEINYEEIMESLEFAKEITEIEYISFKSLFECGAFGEIYSESIMERLGDEYDYDEDDEEGYGEIDDEEEF